MPQEQEDLVYLRRLLGGQAFLGDDAALLRLPGRILATTDPVVEGRHFEPGTPAARVGRKLVHRNFSDLAAMGARPLAVLAGFCFGPGWDRRRRRRLFRAVKERVEFYGASWVGGDLSSIPGPAVLSMTALGRPAGRRPVPRSGLRPGHLLCVTGPLGGSSVGGRHLDFEPRVEVGCRLARAHRPSAMMDLSDGLALDLSRMLEASGGLGATLIAGAVPLHPSASRSVFARGELGPLGSALFEGEDYELLLGIRKGDLLALRRDPALPETLGRPIGRVEARPGLWLEGRGGILQELPAEGWEHGFD